MWRAATGLTAIGHMVEIAADAADGPAVAGGIVDAADLAAGDTRNFSPRICADSRGSNMKGHDESRGLFSFPRCRAEDISKYFTELVLIRNDIRWWNLFSLAAWLKPCPSRS